MSTSRFRTEFSVQSFGDVSRFLRAGIADEESRELRDSVGELAQHIDDIIGLRRGTGSSLARLDRADEELIRQGAARLADAVQAHQLLLTGLGSAWHGLYEMGSYQNALSSLRRAIDTWQEALVRRRSADESKAYAHLEPLAWRTLGEGLLLIDMYRHGESGSNEPGKLVKRPPAAPSYWARFWRAVRPGRR